MGASTAQLIEGKQRLLQLIPEMPFGAPATNITVPPEQARRIEEAAAWLEQVAARRMVDLSSEASLSDGWRLVYSNAAEIVNQAKLPLGFELGPVFQPIDLQGQAFENQAAVDHDFGLASLSTRVVGDLRRAPPGTVNAAGVVNDAGNRVDVDFRRVVFSLDSIFGVSVNGLLRKVVSPKTAAGAAQTAIDITYLDADIRVTRGGDGALFVLRRASRGSSPPMLAGAARDAVLREAGADVVTGAGLGNWSRTAGPGVIAGFGN